MINNKNFLYIFIIIFILFSIIFICIMIDYENIRKLRKISKTEKNTPNPKQNPEDTNQNIIEIACSSNCKNGGTCDTTTGKCICPKNFFGDDCSEYQVNFVPNINCQNDCKNGGTCDKNTGKCKCIGNFSGDDCSKCRPYIYGPNCDRAICQDDTDCQSNGGICDKTTGKCLTQKKDCKPNCYVQQNDNNKKCGGLDGCNDFCNKFYLTQDYFSDPNNSLVWRLQNKYTINDTNNISYDYNKLEESIPSTTPTLAPENKIYTLKSSNGGPDISFSKTFNINAIRIYNDITIADGSENILKNTIYAMNKDGNYEGNNYILTPINCNGNCLTFINDDKNCGYCGNDCTKENKKCCGKKCIEINNDNCANRNCFETCQKDFINCGGICISTDKVKTDCTCKSGFKGDMCQYSNETTCSGHGTVDDNGTCTCVGNWATRDASTGQCNFCPSNFDPTDPNCTKCQKYYYGDSCKNNCLNGSITMYDYKNNNTSSIFNLYNPQCCPVALNSLLQYGNLYTPIQNLSSFITQNKIRNSSLLILLVGNLTLNTVAPSLLTKVDDKTFLILNTEGIAPVNFSITNNDTQQTVNFSNVQRKISKINCRNVSPYPWSPDYRCQLQFQPVKFDENNSLNYKKYSISPTGSGGNNLPEILLIGPEFSQDSRCLNTCTHGRCLYPSSTCPPNYDQSDPNCQKCANNWTGINCDECPDNFDVGNNCQGCINYWQGPKCTDCPNTVKQDGNCNELIPTSVPTTRPSCLNSVYSISVYDINNNNGSSISLFNKDTCDVYNISNSLQPSGTNIYYTPISNIKTELNNVPLASLVIILVGNLSMSTSTGQFDPNIFSIPGFSPVGLRDYDPAKVKIIPNPNNNNISFNLYIRNNDTGVVQSYITLSRKVTINNGITYYYETTFVESDNQNFFKISTPTTGKPTGVNPVLPEILIIGPELNS